MILRVQYWLVCGVSCDSEDRDVSKLVVWINNFTPL